MRVEEIRKKRQRLKQEMNVLFATSSVFDLSGSVKDLHSKHWVILHLMLSIICVRQEEEWGEKEREKGRE